MRKYIEQKGLGETLVPLIGVWERSDDIEWDKLPSKFVLKCNHGCDYHIICSEKSKFDRNAAVK